MERKVHGPESEYLTDVEVAAWLRLEVDYLHQLVKNGKFPAGIPYKKRIGGHVWPWMDVLAVGHLVARGFIKIAETTVDE